MDPLPGKSRTCPRCRWEVLCGTRVSRPLAQGDLAASKPDRRRYQGGAAPPPQRFRRLAPVVQDRRYIEVRGLIEGDYPGAAQVGGSLRPCFGVRRPLSRARLALSSTQLLV